MHVFEAAGYTLCGLRQAMKETAFCLECVGLFFVAGAALVLPFSFSEAAVLVAAWVGVMCIELINTAIETIVDLVSPDYHDLAKKAKDLGSAAVAVAVFANIILWAAFLWDAFAG